MATRRLNDFTIDGKLGVGVTTPSHKLDVSGSAQISGDVLISDYIKHIGDTDTTLRFQTNAILINAGGSENISATATQLTLSGGSADVDVRIEGSSNADLLFADTSANKIGIGTNSPAVSLDINATDAVTLPTGTTAQRPTAAAGMIRYNTTDGSFEGYTSEWGAIGGGDDFSLKSITKNASNQFPITFADSTNFKLSASGTWTITATIASGDVGKSGIILIVNTAATTPGALPSTFKTPNGDNIVFETDSGDYSVISYFIASTTHVLVNYVGNFS